MKPNIIAVTNSFNYSDIIPFVIDANRKFFKAWYFVTTKEDEKTMEIARQNDIEILIHDFKIRPNFYDEGGGLKVGQEQAFSKYPDDWYVRIDSDICLPEDFESAIDFEMDEDAVYGARRFDYLSLKEYREGVPFFKYEADFMIPGYFQLYKKHVLYPEGKFPLAVPGASFGDATKGVDLVFLDSFEPSKRFLLEKLVVSHLGSGRWWYGNRRVDQPDFIIGE